VSSDGTTARIFGGRYVLGDQLTAGDGREVWRAHDDIVSRSAALKIYFGPTAADPQWRERFRHDADRLATLSHPGIATLYEHDESDVETWLALAYVDGQTLTERLLAEPRLSAAEAFDVVGQTAMAVAAAHDVGLAHGALQPDSLLIRSGGSTALIGFALGAEATRADDLVALRELTWRCLDNEAGAVSTQPAEIDDFVKWLTGVGRGAPPDDAAEIGRTALALASSLRGGHTTTATPPAPRSAMTDTPGDPPRYDEAERKTVRNRLLVLGTIVVVGGAALLRFVGEGAGEVSVPNVVGLQIDQAKLKLTYAGLVPKVTTTVGTDSGGTVISESPLPGNEVKAGSKVTLTVSEGDNG
jgi:serine/threonine protein kinase